MREIGDIRAALGQLPEGEITDEDLDRIGVTAEEFTRVADDDMEREFQARAQSYADPENVDYDDGVGEDNTSSMGMGY